ncbi:MAG TPA: aminotransferase DegT [Elusimicrobia bacterium]|nr:aminotransferase DegT [Elusimicrobiota bacterium]
MNGPDRIPLSEPSIQGAAWKYVRDCLDTGWVSSVGRYVSGFELAIARYTGSRRAVAGVNGTACLHTALRALGIGPGDAVAVPAMTFIATANAVAHCGAECVFVDCDPARFNLDPDALEDLLENRCRRRRGRLLTPSGAPLKAILPAHILGYPAAMARLLRIARRRGLLVIEDAAESIGSWIGGRHTGTLGDAGILSFNGNKIITCGGGGMVLAGDPALARRIKHLTQQAKSSGKEYIHDEIGFNYRMTNLSAALGLSQLELLPRFLRQRERIARWYGRRLGGVPVAPVGETIRWNRWLLSVQAASHAEQERLLKALLAAGCIARKLWQPLPWQKPYRSRAHAPAPNAERAYRTLINIPSSTSLTEAQTDRVAHILKTAALERALL